MSIPLIYTSIYGSVFINYEPLIVSAVNFNGNNISKLVVIQPMPCISNGMKGTKIKYLLTDNKHATGALGFIIGNKAIIESKRNKIDIIFGLLPSYDKKFFEFGNIRVEFWCRDKNTNSTFIDKKNNFYLLVGSPMNSVIWEEVINQLDKQSDQSFLLPWEGRCLLLRVNPDGKDWTIWNDWCGSIPVYHTLINKTSFLSSLEPIVAETANLNSNSFSKRGIVELLLFGHFIGTDTLYNNLSTIQPDSVSFWKNNKFYGYKALKSVVPTDVNWDKNINQLTKELYEKTFEAVGSAITMQAQWILPLSGGMDSRIIACVGADLGAKFESFTYGPSNWQEVIYAKLVANQLQIPWQRIEIDPNHLKKFTPLWLNWFGSSLHAHGMYQMPFLEYVKELNIPIIQGFMGDPLVGNHLLMNEVNESDLTIKFLDTFGLWSSDEIFKILEFDSSNIVKEISNNLLTQFHSLSGANFQRWMFLDFWNRQRNFIFYQPLMYDYWNGVSTPFMNRSYARFCLSLPKKFLINRLLQKEMLKKYWPKLAELPGTFSPFPIQTKKMWRLTNMIASRIPQKMRFGFHNQFWYDKNKIQINALVKHGMESLHPFEKEESFTNQSIFKKNELRNLVNKAIQGIESEHVKLRPIQTIIYRIINR